MISLDEKLMEIWGHNYPPKTYLKFIKQAFADAGYREKIKLVQDDGSVEEVEIGVERQTGFGDEH